MTRQRYVLLVDINPALSILGQPPAATLGEAYSFTFQYFGGTAPYTCTVVGSVPSGWTFNAGTGVLSHPGPSTPGTLSLTLKLRDADYRETAPTTYTWSVVALPLLITNALPDYTAGVAQSFSYTTTGGAGSKTFAVTAGSLPPGLTLSSAGAISGTTTGLSVGTHTYTFDVTATDAYGATYTLSESVTVTVAALSITNAAPDGRVGVAYSHTYTKSGGTGMVTWDVASGTLPGGLTLSSAGVLSGTPTTQQTATFTVRATDAAATAATEAESVLIAYPTLALSGSYAAGTISTAYTSDLTISGGNAPYSLTGGTGLISGSLPAGLSLSVVGSVVRLSGTPTAEASYSFTVGVSSSDGQSATSAQSVTVSHPGKRPDEVSGLTLWLDASDPTYTFKDTACTTPVTAHDDIVKGLKNKVSGVGSNFTSGISSQKWKTSAQNGRAVVNCASAIASYFTGSALSTYIAADKATVLVVCRTSGITDTNTNYTAYSIYADTADYFGLHYTTASPARFISYNWDSNDDYASTSVGQGSFHVVLVQHMGGSIKSSVDGGTKSSTASGNTGNRTNNLCIGNILGKAGSVDIAEVVTYNSAITDADLADVITWLKWRWGIA